MLGRIAGRSPEIRAHAVKRDRVYFDDPGKWPVDGDYHQELGENQYRQESGHHDLGGQACGAGAAPSASTSRTRRDWVMTSSWRRISVSKAAFAC
jgi:hypothetical protein